MNEIKIQRLEIALSIFIAPCTESELLKRDFLKNKFIGNTQKYIMQLENDDAIYYKGDVMYIKKEWAKKNLKGYDIDFSTDKEKYMNGLTPFAREIIKKQNNG